MMENGASSHHHPIRAHRSSAHPQINQPRGQSTMSLKRDEVYEDKSGSNKKQKVARGSDRTSALLDDLDPLAIDQILHFLDVKSLFRFAFSSSHFRDVVSHEHVVRSALISGGHAKKTVSEVIQLALEEKTIYLPSPLRLLRLANGKFCEYNHCCGGSDGTRVHHIRSGYGVFFCWACVTSMTDEIKNKDKMLLEKRVAASRYTVRSFVFSRPFLDSAGEPAGPIISRHEYLNRKGDYLAEKFKKADEGGCEQRDVILKCLAQANTDRDRIEKEKRDAQKNRIDKKHLKVVGVIKNLHELLADCEYQDTLCEYTELLTFSSAKPSITMHCRFAHDVMLPFILAPSKATRKKLIQAAAEITSTIEMLRSSGFLDCSFLEKDDEWHNLLRNFLRGKFPAETLLTTLSLRGIELVRSNQLLLAFVQCHGYGRESPHPWVSLVGKCVVQKFTPKLSLPERAIRDLAQAVFISCFDFDHCTPSSFRDACVVTENKFGWLMQAAVPGFISYLNRKAAQFGMEKAEDRKEYERATVNSWSRVTAVVELLEGKNYASLLKFIDAWRMIYRSLEEY